MTLRHLRIFVTVCETGSMTAAAGKLYLAQPSISLAISEMESHYGVRLFDRISRRLYLTDKGRQVLEYARHIIDLFDEMEQHITAESGLGHLRVGTSITVGTYLLPGCISRLQKQFPALQVEAVVGNSETIEAKILENEIDLGIIEGAVHSSYIRQEMFEGDRMVFICPISHGFAGKKLEKMDLLQGEKLLLREKGSAGREIFDGLLAARELSVKPCFESVSNQAILEAVKEGLGISLLPWYLVKEALKEGKVAEFTINDISLTRKFSVIWHKNKFLTKEALALKELIQ